MTRRVQTPPPAQLSLEDAPTAPVRTIHYLGGKARIVSAIGEAVRSVTRLNSRVCDLFSGSGIVAHHLLRDFDVVAVDVQEYARVLVAAITTPASHGAVTALGRLSATAQSHPALASSEIHSLIAHEADALDAAVRGDASQLCEVIEDGSIMASQVQPSTVPEPLSDLLAAAATLELGPHTVLTRYYGGIYFSYQQAAELDALVTAARALKGPIRDVALAAVIATASELVSTVGNQFAQPLRPRGADGTAKIGAIRSVAMRRQKAAIPTFERWLSRFVHTQRPTHNCTSVRADYRDALENLPNDTSAIYADPPYTRDHYSRFYHVLETIALGDEPTVSTVKIRGNVQLSRGLYRDDRHQSPFCIKSEAPLAFEDLFRATEQRRIPLVLSYSPYSEGAHPRVMTVENIERLAGKFFSDVRIHPTGRLAHSKLNAERLNLGRRLDAELLLVCRP